jgi:hypothetical protein
MTHCRPIFIHNQTTHWEISPPYLEYCLSQSYDYDNVARVFMDTSINVGEKKKPKPKKKAGKKYKPMVNRVHSVATTLPEELHIVQRLLSDPLKDMPVGRIPRESRRLPKPWEHPGTFLFSSSFYLLIPQSASGNAREYLVI